MLKPCFCLQVLIKKERQEVSALEQAPAGAPAGVKCYKATFKPAIKKGSSQEFDVVATITGAFTPNPAKIEQTDRQFVEYRDNLFLLSPYVVESQTTVVSAAVAVAADRLWLPAVVAVPPANDTAAPVARPIHPAPFHCGGPPPNCSMYVMGGVLCCSVQATLPNSDIKFATELKSSKSGSKVTWGDFDRQQPWTVQELKLHFYHDKPFKRVRLLGLGVEGVVLVHAKGCVSSETCPQPSTVRVLLCGGGRRLGE